MLRALISEMREPELTYPPQALKLGSIDEAHQQIADVIAGVDADYIVYGVTVNPFAHNLDLVFKFWTMSDNASKSASCPLLSAEPAIGI
jgi:hypothetical protein